MSAKSFEQIAADAVVDTLHWKTRARNAEAENQELLAALQWIAEHPREFGDIEDAETMLAYIVAKAYAAIAKVTGGAA